MTEIIKNIERIMAPGDGEINNTKIKVQIQSTFQAFTNIDYFPVAWKKATINTCHRRGILEVPVQ
jgi:hypothetical protein